MYSKHRHANGVLENNVIGHDVFFHVFSLSILSRKNSKYSMPAVSRVVDRIVGCNNICISTYVYCICIYNVC